MKEMNDMITVLFDALADEKLKRGEESAKMKADQGVIAALTENLEVWNFFDIFS